LGFHTILVKKEVIFVFIAVKVNKSMRTLNFSIAFKRQLDCARQEPVFLNNSGGAQESIPPAIVAWMASTTTLFLLGS
jgi:hypothetical protein